MQKTSSQDNDCPRGARTESGSYYEGVQTYIWMAEDNVVEVPFDKEHLLEVILSPKNLNDAYKCVVRNKGCGGVDKMSCEQLLPWLRANKDNLIKCLMDGSYRPNPVRRVEIPKDNGKKRLLGIPTVVDRMVQQAINQVLTPIYEKQFSRNSFGFRPRLGCHDALRKAQSIITDGYKYVVDLDLERFFDTVSHSKLIEVLSRTIKDGRVISLIHKYLRSGVMVNGLFVRSEEGTPQGGPLSPLLSNVMLNELDKELERRGLPFVRYADDSMIFCRSKRAAERVRESITNFYRRQASPEGQQGKDCSLLCAWGKVPRLLILHQQGQVPSDGTPQDQSQDASPLERADGSQQWHGLCQAEGESSSLHKGLGELLSPCHYEETDRGNRRVVTATLAYVYMEVMEASQGPNQEPH